MFTKSFRAPVECKADSDGTFRARISVFDTLDDGGDVVLPSFFQDGQELPLAAWGHDWESLNPGKGVIRVTPQGAVFEGQFNLNTTIGKETYETVRFNAGLQEWSFGYKVLESERGSFEGQPARFLKLGEIYEACPVLVGMNRETATLDIKSATATKKPWDTAYVNDLDDSAFALILPGGKKDDAGKTTPRSLRKFPHHSTSGAVDLPHVRNGLSRAPQADITDAQKTKAESHLQKHLDDAKKGANVPHDAKGFSLLVTEPPEGSYEDLAEDITEAMVAQGYADEDDCVTTLATFGPNGPGYAYVCVLDDPDGNMSRGLYDFDAMTTYYRVEYSLDADGDPVLGGLSEVEPGVVFTPAEEPALDFAGLRAVAAVRRYAARVRAGRRGGRKEGRMFSSANVTRMEAVIGAIRDAADELERTLAGGAGSDEAGKAAEREYVRYLAEEARRNGVAVGA